MEWSFISFIHLLLFLNSSILESLKVPLTLFDNSAAFPNIPWLRVLGLAGGALGITGGGCATTTGVVVVQLLEAKAVLILILGQVVGVGPCHVNIGSELDPMVYPISLLAQLNSSVVVLDQLQIVLNPEFSVFIGHRFVIDTFTLNLDSYWLILYLSLFKAAIILILPSDLLVRFLQPIFVRDEQHEL